MGMPPELSGMMEMLASINQPTAGDHINDAIQSLNEARKMDDKVAPIVSRAIDILKGSCGDEAESDDDDENSPMNGPSSKPSSY